MKTAFHSKSARSCVVVNESTHEGATYYDVVLFGDAPAVEHMKTLPATELAFDDAAAGPAIADVLTRLSSLESRMAAMEADFKAAPATPASGAV